MKEIIVNDLILYYDDPFRVLGEEETNQMKFYNDSQGICIRNDEEHMMVTVGTKQINGITNFLLFSKDLLNKTQEDIAHAMKPYGYALSEYLTEDADGQEIRGFAYEYETEGIPMYGQAYVAKKDKVVYYLYLYVRRENKENGLKLWKKIIDELKWKK
ncbi:MAG: hypothetical protein IJL85_01340 [Erysipelotrichaceae bacterium]|nr:hypothetical protein [Erysipelotrichaceae bacterium]